MEQITPFTKNKAIQFQGVYFDQDLSFKTYINHIHKKLSTALYFLRTAKNFFNSQSLTHLYYTLFHSHLVYANSIWSSTSSSNFPKFFKRQKAAIRIISGEKYNAHTEPLFKANVLPLPLLQEYFALDFMQQNHQNHIQEIFSQQFLTNRELRVNPELELRNNLL